MTIHISPDCAYGKHRACHGDAWSNEVDQAVVCDCPCHVQDYTSEPVSLADSTIVDGASTPDTTPGAS